jgi:copper chaperone CopZ
MTTKTYNVPGISCGHCVATIERELKLVEGVQSVKAEQDSKRVTVQVADDNLLPEVERTLVEIGYPAE